MFTYQALQILIFLIPGFISATILNVLIVRKAKNDLSKIVEALIFSLIVYTFYSMISGKSPIQVQKLDEYTTYVYDGKSFLWLSIFSLFIPILLSILFTNDYHMKLARLLRISRRTARSTVWFDVFCDIKRHIIINFENGRRIYGWPMYYSDNPDDPFIFLYKPSWIIEDETTHESEFISLEIDGILITPEQKIETIEFLES